MNCEPLAPELLTVSSTDTDFCDLEPVEASTAAFTTVKYKDAMIISAKKTFFTGYLHLFIEQIYTGPERESCIYVPSPNGAGFAVQLMSASYM
jgi:hypothetical protein